MRKILTLVLVTPFFANTQVKSTNRMNNQPIANKIPKNLVLTASIIDNDVYGNLSVEMVAPWGKYYPFDSKFDERTLFARRGHSPLWLEILAYAIIVGVWAIIIHLLLQLRKTIKLGVE